MIGASAGGLTALTSLLGELPARFPAPVLVVLHRGRGSEPHMEAHFASQLELSVEEAVDKRALQPGRVYLAPAGYHMLIDRPGLLSLSLDSPEHYSRPSVDVLFESAADALGPRVAGVLLTGYGEDGARGLARIAARGGRTAVQDPKTAEVPDMIHAALRRCRPDAMLDLQGLASWLLETVGRPR